MIPPRKHIQEDNVDSWLMSYADMITLLMCFFIIFVSVSEPKKERITAVTNGMGGRFGTVDLSTPFDGVIRALQGVVEARQSFRDMTIEHSDKTIEIELSGGTFFKPDSAELEESAIPLINETIAALLTVNFLDYRVTIESHTSDLPPRSGLFPTNWELSAARSARMVRAFIEQGMKPQYLKAIGLADTQPKVPNLDAAGNAITANREKNARVVIRLERIS